MKLKKAAAKIATAGLALLLVWLLGAPVCYAYPSVTSLTNFEELVTWYNLPKAGLASLTRDIEVSRSMEFTSSYPKGLNMSDWVNHRSYTLRVLPGVTLLVDNPNMELGGEREVITVENGGSLILRHGTLHAATGASTVAIVVKNGGKLTLGNDFILTGKIQDETIVTPPEPPPDNRIPITSLFDDKAHLSCAVGARPHNSQYPETVYAYFGGTGGAELPVEWGLSTVNFGKPGTYSVTGTLTQAGMEAHNLSNPQAFTATMTITVYEPGAVGDARGEVLSVGAAGNTIARLVLPALPTQQISAIYLYHSGDGRVWKKAAYSTPPDGTVQETNYLQATTTVGPSSYIVYKYITDYRPLWVKVEIVGSERSGVSNTVQLIPPADANPGDSIHNGSNEEAGDSGGNRGGGGQTEEKREIPPKPEDTPPPAATKKFPPKNSHGDEPAPPPKAIRPPAQDSGTAAITPAQKAAQDLANPPEENPTGREPKNTMPPTQPIAAVAMGGAGLGGWLFLKKRP